MKRILSIILSITMLLSMATVAFADETSEATVDGTITVGINAEYAPFEYYNEDGELTGFDIDLMNYIGERIGYDIEYVEFPFDRLLPAVASGEVDCAISAITITKERDGVVDYTRPYLEANVIYKDGEEMIEQYAVVFSENSINKARLVEASGDPFHSKYMLVDASIKDLTEDLTIDKLIEKYNLNKALEEDTEIHYEYDTVKGSATYAAKTDTEITMNEEITMTTVPAPSEWAAKDIDYALAVGITDNGKDYLYKENITREEFCELTYNLIVLTSDEITVPVTDSFTDTKNDKILMLNGLGIINGKSATEFAPSDYLTREEAATIIMRMVNKVFPMAATEMWFEYDDINEVSEWASDSIQTISNLGFMNGVGNNKFAPKDTYTTEQAIVTLVRVLESAGAAGLLDENTSLGIIGGADGPTSIIIGENTTVIGGADAPTQITVIDTKKVDDFYIDEAIKLVTESGELAADKEFISYYTANEDMTNKVLSIGAVDYSKPTEIYYMAANREKIIDNIKKFSDEELDGFDIEKLLKLNKVDFSVIGNMINASYGAENLAALTILTNSRGYIMPKDFADDFALYLQYEGEYSALVSFSKFGDGVIKATMSFVNNGDRDNIFSRLYEITQGLGEDSIDVAFVK